ncbi:hypothetical protein BGZ93_007264 [Podila epicladia]|nr:hypothetical protein BGZ93_007264 [Podila epicladia]
MESEINPSHDEHNLSPSRPPPERSLSLPPPPGHTPSSSPRRPEHRPNPEGHIRFSERYQVQVYDVHQPPSKVLPAEEHQREVQLKQELFRQSVGRSERRAYEKMMLRRKRNRDTGDPEGKSKDEEVPEAEDKGDQTQRLKTRVEQSRRRKKEEEEDMDPWKPGPCNGICR